MSTRRIIGLASGSSLSGVSAALVETEGTGLDLQVRPVRVVQQLYARELRDLIRSRESGESAEFKQLCLLHRLLGETFAAAARQAADRASLSLQRVQCIGCSGHTVRHEPDGRFPSTLTIGMPAIVAERTGVTTISDFRSRDLAVGGQGASLEALADYLLFRHATETRVLLHLGGSSSLVALPAGGHLHEVVGFEIGPGTALLDGLLRHFTAGKEEFDAGGKHGAQGCRVEPLLERWLNHPYFSRRPPKSLPQPTFADEFVLQGIQLARNQHEINDLICTATHLVAHCILAACRRYLGECWPPDRVILSGGGTRNGLLWQLLEQQFSPLPLEKTEHYGIPVEGRDAVASAVLAALTVDGVTGNRTHATGASGSRLLGSLTPGSSANWARCLAWMAAQTAPLAAAHD
jgi:anhydro-N-acetylmuramic acid kinase